MIKILRFLLFFTGLTLLASCGNSNIETLRILKVTEHGSAIISDSAITNVLHNHLGIKVELQYDLEEEVALQKLSDGSVDMAILPSNTQVRDGYAEVTTVMPLLPRVFMVLKKPDVKASTLKELLENHRVLYEDMSVMDSLFFEQVFRSFDINLSRLRGKSVKECDLRNLDERFEVYIGLTHLNNPFVAGLLEQDWNLYSLDEVEMLGHGSSVEGFQISFPWAYPYILPRDFYVGKPEKPVLTVAIRDVLVCREDFDAHTVYKVMGTLIENKSSLVRQNTIYAQLPTEIDKKNLSFPLHKGALDYLNRDKPSIWVRYANTIWPVISVIAILLGAAASFHRRLKNQLKDRIDKYYVELLKIRSHAFSEHDSRSKEELMEDLQYIRSRAFESLKNNKLVADNSFMIFLRLYQEIAREIENKK